MNPKCQASNVLRREKQLSTLFLTTQPRLFPAARVLLMLVWTMLVGGVASDAFAQTRTWTGAVSNDWSVAGNWTPSGVPTATSDVVIPAGATPTLNQNVSVRSVSVSGQLLVNSTLSLSNGLTMDSGRVTFNTGTQNGGLFLQGGTQTVGGTGTLTFSSDASLFAIGASVTVAPGVSIVATGGNSRLRTDPTGSMNVLGTVEARSGNITVSGVFANSDSAGTWTGGTWRATSAGIFLPSITTIGQSTTFIFAGGFIDGFSTVNFNAGAIRLEAGVDLAISPGSAFFNAGSMSLSAGSVFTVQNQEFRQLAGGSLNMFIGGPAPSQLAQVVTTGSRAVRLAGALSVSYTGLAPLDPCSTFLLVGGSQRVGAFSSNAFALPSGQFGEALTLANSLSLRVRNQGESCPAAPTCDADFNNDGNADAADVDALINVIAGGLCP